MSFQVDGQNFSGNLLPSNNASEIFQNPTMIDKRVRYQPSGSVDDLVKSMRRRISLRRKCLPPLLIFTVIILISFYMAGIFSYLFEEDFTKFKYPLEINDVNDLVDKIDESLLSDGKATKVMDYSTIAKVLDLIKTSDSRWLGVKPVPQFMNLNFPLDVQTKCQQQWNNLNHSSLTMIIVVKSAVNNFARRNAIRRSWYLNGTLGLMAFKTAFMVGACHENNPIPSSIMIENGSWSTNDCSGNIIRESLINGDIIQSSGIDSYYNNTVKTFMTLRWLSERCQSDFALFIDDDYVLEVENLMEYMIDLSTKKSASVDSSASIVEYPDLREVAFKQLSTGPSQTDSMNQTSTLGSLHDLSENYLYAGYLRDYVHPGRIVMTKWYITRKEYAYNKYPRFITGGAMLMTHKTIRHMHYVSYFTNAFKFDDVYIGILARKLGISPIHANSFMCNVEDYMEANPVRPNSTSCIGVHDIEPTELTKLWENRRKTAR